ncbi:BTB/POZ domain-containing protein, partial [Ananas comosus]
TQETGLPTSVRVRVDGRSYDLHKSPLTSKCGYFRRALLSSSDVELPENFPGGFETFEMVALFSYGYPLSLDPFNVSALRCAAEQLEMTEEYAFSNLGERSDLYINQVVLQGWDDTLIVLQKCQPLLPISEELLIVSRCVESLAFMACMEILDPEQRRDRPVISVQALSGRAWNSEKVKQITGQDLWIKDLIALPFEFFKRIIGSLRRQGMKEKYVSPVVLFYANKWVLSKKTHKFWESTDECSGAEEANNKVSAILEGLLELFPAEEKADGVIPVSFYFALLARSLSLKLSEKSREKLEHQVASRLQFARVEDFPLPESGTIAFSPELKAMENIISNYASSNSGTDFNRSTHFSSSIVAELWDRYLSQIARDPKLEPHRFVQLIEAIPVSFRETHDHLYGAISIFLLEHPDLSGEEKASVCKHIDCQKLSQEACIDAVQNELMPLRLIVQALFIQQLQTHQALRDCSDSFRYTYSVALSGTGFTPTSRSHPPTSQNLSESPYKQLTDESPYKQVCGEGRSGALSHHVEYESASFRLQALEDEITAIKKNLQGKSTSKKQSFRLFGREDKVLLKRRSHSGQVSTCIGSLSWASQRKCASGILKMLRRIALLGKGKAKMKQSSF